MKDNLCCICLEDIGDKSFLQKVFDIKKTCDCQYYIHNKCFFNYIHHRINNGNDISCVVCKSEMVSYDHCMRKTNKLHKKIVNLSENILSFMKLIAIVIISSTFIQLLRQTLYRPF